MLTWIVAVLLLIVAIGLYGHPSYRIRIDAPDEQDPAVDYWIYQPDSLPGGDYAFSVFGKTRYYLFGKEDGPRIVLVHGLGSPSNTFEKLAPVLVQAGYRVLVYDLFGRGFSDAPPALYDEKLHTMQLYFLLKHVGWTACSILGFSMGGGIAACFAQQYPHMVDRLILVAPAGVIDKKDLPRFARMTSLPYIGYVFSGLLNKLTSIHAVHQAIVGSLPHDSEYVFARSVIDQVRAHKGFTRALTSSMHYFPFDRLHHVYDAIGKQAFPVMTIWTSQDEAVHYPKCADRLRWHMPRAEEYVVLNARHSFIHSHGEQIGRMITTYSKE